MECAASLVGIPRCFGMYAMSTLLLHQNSTLLLSITEQHYKYRVPRDVELVVCPIRTQLSDGLLLWHPVFCEFVFDTKKAGVSDGQRRALPIHFLEI